MSEPRAEQILTACGHEDYWSACWDCATEAIDAAVAEARRAERAHWVELVTEAEQPHTCGQGITETCEACWARERLLIHLRADPAGPA